ncbi:MAG: PD-(D/E)XK nuclease family protein [Desulfonatronovibrio sp.]
MNLNRIDSSQAFESLEKGASLITSSRRLSRHLSLDFAGYQLKKSRKAWETPIIIPFQSWLESLFSHLPHKSDRIHLLSPEQEECLWEEIIVSCNPEKILLGLSGLSDTASTAYDILIRYKLNLCDIQDHEDQEILAFINWLRKFEEICLNKNFLSSSRLTGCISESLDLLAPVLPDNLIFAGFLEFDPVQEELLKAFEHAGISLLTLDKPHARSEPECIACKDFKSEALTSAYWALNQTLSHPRDRIGIVVPDLKSRRSQITKVFDHVFHPETLTNPAEPQKRAYNVSLGEPLGHTPLVRAALIFLSLLKENQLKIHDLGTILFSPFIKGHEQEFSHRAALDLRLRKGSQPWRTVEWVIEKASNPAKKYYCPIFSDFFSQARELAEISQIQSPALWARHFSKLLKMAGWPDSRVMNSFEYQTFQAFKNELSRLSCLETVLLETTYSQALEKLNTLCHKRIFQPESTSGSIQVLGLFEASGLEFDHLWVMNMNADTLPAQASPNPLLPVDLQRKHLTPGSSPSRELNMASGLIDLLLKSSPRVTFSFSTHEDDMELQPSPFLKNIPPSELSKPGINPGPDPVDKVFQSSRVEDVIDNQGLPFDKNWISGGTRTFQNQALCPFKGYALHRLKASLPEEPVFALTSIERGNLVHKAMMRLWQEAGSLEELRELYDEQSLDGLLDELVSITVNEMKDHVLFTREFSQLEQIRLKNLVRAWLEIELKRSDFEIAALEEKQIVTLGDMKISTRLDRMDRMPDQSLTIIDYKTGSNIESVKRMWAGQRITEPQLPIYAQIAENDISAVLLAQINPRKFKFHGLVRDTKTDFAEKGLQTPEDLGKEDFKEILNQWKNNLEDIAGEIKSGHALIDPLPQQGDKTCRYCELKPLCRINEQP